MTNLNCIPTEFLRLLKDQGVSMASEGINDTALPPIAAQRAIALLRSASLGITGGEVWKKVGERFIPTYDIWDIERSDYSTHEAYVQASLDLSDRQVEKYIGVAETFVVTLGL